MSEHSRAEVQQFKNAYHMFRDLKRQSNTFNLQFSPQRVLRKESQGHSRISLFGPSPMSRHFKDSNISGGKSRSSLEGVGITVDDSGNLLVGQWRNNQIEGRYFLFKPILGEEGEKSGSSSAICMYGTMKAGSLSGDNYMYNISGSLAKASFQNNKILGRAYIIHSNKLFVADETNKLEKIECEVVNCDSSAQQTNKNSNILVIPKISVSHEGQSKNGPSGNKFPSTFEQVDADIFVKPNRFLEELVVAAQGQRQKKGDSLVYTHINDRQVFLGFLQTDKNQNIPSDIKERINGFGVMLKNEWPTSYGTFKEGKLQGLGRFYQTQMSIFDGYFSGGELMQGFILDYFAQTTSFGHQSSIDAEFNSHSHQQHYFIITDTFQTLSSEYLTEYKKNFHLKSLNFNNSYFNAPKLIHRSPWPYNIINKLTKRSQIQTIIKSFRPTLTDMEISQIEKIGHSSQNLVEKMLVQEIHQSPNPSVKEESMLERQQLMRQRSNFIKSEIERNLKEKDYWNQESSRNREINNYVSEYKRLERRKTEMILEQKPRTANKEEGFNKTASDYKQHKQHKEQKQKKDSSAAPIKRVITNYQQPSQQEPLPLPDIPISASKQPSIQSQNNPPPSHDLTQLVQQYQKCQTQRKNSISGGTTRRSTTPRQLYSKRQLIQQDYLHFLGNERRVTAVRPPSDRRKVDLDLIYRHYLRK